jgi:hypothetical protein
MSDTSFSPSSQRSWRGILPIHPAADDYPLLALVDKDALAQLGADIKGRGLELDVVLFREGDKEFLLDGRNRLDALEASGVNLVKNGALDRTLGLCGGNRVRVVTDVDPYALTLSLNAHRRHLTHEQRDERITARIARAPEKSNRQLGKELGCDHKTIAAARAKGEDVGRIPHVSKRKDTKGRRQPSTKPTKAAIEKSTITTITPASRDDGGAGSSGKVGRLTARIDELLIEKRRLELRCTGLESEVEELKAAAPPRALTVEQHLAALEELLLNMPLTERENVLRPFVHRVRNATRGSKNEVHAELSNVVVAS